MKLDLPFRSGHIDGYGFIQAPGSLSTSGVGNCTGIVVYNPYLKIGGLAHLPLYSSFTSDEKKGPAHNDFYQFLGLLQEYLDPTKLKLILTGMNYYSNKFLVCPDTKINQINKQVNENRKKILSEIISYGIPKQNIQTAFSRTKNTVTGIHLDLEKEIASLEHTYLDFNPWKVSKKEISLRK
jgi:hypothetical protein